MPILQRFGAVLHYSTKNPQSQILNSQITISFLHFCKRKYNCSFKTVPDSILYTAAMHQIFECNCCRSTFPFSPYLSKMMSRLKLRLAYAVPLLFYAMLTVTQWVVSVFGTIQLSECCKPQHQIDTK